MIELAFIVCLHSSPGVCEERSLLFTDISPMQCLMGAQPELAKWAEGHQNWRVAEWKCQMLQTAEKEV